MMRIFYGVKKNGRYMRKYRCGISRWVLAPEAAWLTRDKDMAKGFAQLTSGTAIKFILTEKPVEPEEPA